MINPLDLPGPQFLVLYAVFGVAVLSVLWMRQSSGEGGAPPRLDMSDPYRLAYLRGGASEAARVATVALIDRGLLTVEDDKVKSTPDRHEPRAPLEGAIVRACAQPHLITQVCGAADVIAATERYEKELVRLALLPDDATRSARSRRLTVAIAILGALSAAKLGVALSRGRTNVGFLIILTIVFVVIAIKLTRRFRTARGNALLADVRRLFSRLRARRRVPARLCDDRSDAGGGGVRSRRAAVGAIRVREACVPEGQILVLVVVWRHVLRDLVWGRRRW